MLSQAGICIKRALGAAVQVDKTFLSKLPVLGHGKAVYHVVHAAKYHKDKAVSATAISGIQLLGLLMFFGQLTLLNHPKCLNEPLHPLHHCLQAVLTDLSESNVCNAPMRWWPCAGKDIM